MDPQTKYSFCGPIDPSFIAAKNELRDRLFAQAIKSVTMALAVRKARRFVPTPGVNLVGVGIGEEITGGRQTGEQCVKVLVAKKFPLGKISRAHRLPSKVAGFSGPNRGDRGSQEIRRQRETHPETLSPRQYF